MQEIRKYNKIIVANWKLNGSFPFINSLKSNIELDIYVLDKVCIIICPPFPYIKHLNIDYIFKGSQDCSFYLNFILRN